MRIQVTTNEFKHGEETRVGNVYMVKGGRGLRYGHMMILFAITARGDYRDPMALMLIINKEGEPVGVTQYAMHYIEDQMPVAFCEGINEIDLTIRSL